MPEIEKRKVSREVWEHMQKQLAEKQMARMFIDAEIQLLEFGIAHTEIELTGFEKNLVEVFKFKH